MREAVDAKVTVGPIARIGIRHVLATGLELGMPMRGSEWREGEVGAEAIEIRHRLGNGSSAAAPAVFTVNEHASYHDLGDGRIAVRMKGIVPDVDTIMLETIVPGRCYDVRYSEAPSRAVPPNIVEIPAYALALAERRAGVLAHGCAFVMPSGRAALCLGVSGAGKSTLARMMQTVPGVQVLNDDRIVLADPGDGMRAWSTPWPGRAGIAKPGDAPLGAVAIIGRGPGRSKVALQPRAKRAALLQTLAVPVWNAEQAGAALELIETIQQTTPIAQLVYPLADDTGQWILDTMENLASL